MKEPGERRKHMRFEVREDAFVMFGPKSLHSVMAGKIIDISWDGLAFLYVTSKKRENGSFELGITFPYQGFYVGKVPVKRISDFEIAEEDREGHVMTRRCSVKFGKLSQDQIYELEYLMRIFTNKV